MEFLISTAELPERLTFIKNRYGLGNSELGRHGKVSGTAIALILEGKTKKPKYETLASISTSLGISLKWLATGEGDIDDREPGNPGHSPESAAFAQETIDRIIGELKGQYETRLAELKALYESRIAELKDQTGDLREQLKFNREMVQAFKEGHLGKSEGAPIRPFSPGQAA